MHQLELSKVSAGYGRSEVLHEVTFQTLEPSIYVVLGPNGAGKTTLFRTIAGILRPRSGRIIFDGKNMADDVDLRKSINYLSHFNALPEEMTVYEALQFYQKIEGGDIEHVIDELDLSELRRKKIADLSQGQRKRVSIAKVFLCERNLYLLDEPTTSLDPRAAREIRELLTGLAREKVVLYSSHNLYEAREVGSFLILLRDGYVKFFDKISNLKPKKYRYGIKTATDISQMINADIEGGYYVVRVNSPEEAGKILTDLVQRGVVVTEMRELDNPLEELFE
ncbi:MAG TPA: heme ABC exporter ATP-binding protein CcmA [Candidatus Bathyarchaeia archaeon]|nr:heme ABC exporter ATP-binding protein CcmA [Candidatus Bathyarchaeia archaeon]